MSFFDLLNSVTTLESYSMEAVLLVGWKLKSVIPLSAVTLAVPRTSMAYAGVSVPMPNRPVVVSMIVFDDVPINLILSTLRNSKNSAFASTDISTMRGEYFYAVTTNNRNRLFKQLAPLSVILNAPFFPPRLRS